MNPYFECRGRVARNELRMNTLLGSRGYGRSYLPLAAGADDIMMQNIGLAAIDRRTVAARMEVEGRQVQFLRGRGVFQYDEDLGPVLKILVSDPEGDFELILRADEWTGSIESGEALGCDYLVKL